LTLKAGGQQADQAVRQTDRPREEEFMRKLLLTVGLIALAIGLLWIGQGTGVVTWPRSSFMINEMQWAGYGATLSAVGLILIWQSQR
jgi:uncharacterized membrane protein